MVEEDLTEAGRAPRFWWLTDWRWLVPIASAAAVLLAVWVIDPAPLIEPQVSTVRDDSVSNAATGSVEETAERRQPVALERQDVSPAERENFAPETEQALLQDQDEVSALDQVTAAVAGRRPAHILNPDALDHPRVQGWLTAAAEDASEQEYIA